MDEIRFEVTKDGIGYTRHQEPGAIPNGSRVVKVTTEPNDGHEIGALATVLGSIKNPDDPRYFYFVAWDDAPEVPVGVVSTKIAPLDASKT